MLEIVLPKTPDHLQEAIARFVRTKRALNDDDPTSPPKAAGYEHWAASLDPDAFMDRSMPGYSCDPLVTLRHVLPFFPSQSQSGTLPRPASVPVALTMGSSWRWPEHEVPNQLRSAAGWEAYFTDEERVRDDTASVTHVRQLGLFFVRGEGKNRVAFLAKRQVEFMPCLLSDIDYPQADRLRVLEVFEGPLRTWLCVLDGEFVVTIPYPEFTLPLLDAYGVIRQKDWQLAEVMPETVLNCVRKQQGDNQICGMRSGLVRTPLELTRIAEVERSVQEAPDNGWRRLVGLEQVEFDWFRWIGVACLLAICAIGLGLFDATRSAAIFLIGALCAWVSILALRCRTRREHIPFRVTAAKAAEQYSP